MIQKNHTKLLISVLLLLAISSIWLAGCSSEVSDSPEVARIGDKVLRADEISATLDELGLNASDAGTRATFIGAWVDRQLLLYAAKDRNLDHDREILEKVATLHEELMINKLYDLEEKSTIPSEGEIIKYWNDHTGEFTRTSTEVKLVMILVSSRNMGWQVRNMLDQSRSGLDIMGTYEAVEVDSTGWLDIGHLPGSVLRNTKSLRVNDPSLPFQMETGQWAVLKLMKRAHAGDTRSVEEVSDDIRRRLIAEKHSHSMIDLLASLRQEARRKGIVAFSIPGDPSVALLEEFHSTYDSVEITEESDSLNAGRSASIEEINEE